MSLGHAVILGALIGFALCPVGVWLFDWADRKRAGFDKPWPWST